MYKYYRNGVSILSVLDTRRMKRTGLYPVKIQIVYRRKQKYYPAGYDLSESDWTRLPTAKGRHLSDIRYDIEDIFIEMKNIVKEILASGPFSFEILEERLGKGSISVNDAIKEKISRLEQEERIGTMKQYQSLLANLVKYAGNNISFSDITPEWLYGCERFWSADRKKKSSIGTYFRLLRAIMNSAKDKGMIKESLFPFGMTKYEITSSGSRKRALANEEIKKLMDYGTDNPETEMYRDLWVFSYLCNGINFRDLIYLRHSNIINGEICFIRTKTRNTAREARMIKAALTSEMIHIIDKWGNGQKTSDDTMLFRFATGNENVSEAKKIVAKVVRNCNRFLKRIAVEIGIEPLTTYSARHSFATVLKRKGANIAYISESLGHSNPSVTECYLAEFEKEERIRNARLLTDFSTEMQK